MGQKTPVEYLFEQLWETPKDKFTWHSILKKAKEIEEQRMFEFWNDYFVTKISNINN